MEDVVDHLDGVGVSALHERDGVVRLVVVDGYAEEADLPFGLQRLDGLQPVAAAEPLVAPYVELQDVERVQPGLPEAGLQAGPDVRARKGVGRVHARGRRPDPVLRRHLRRDVQVRTRALADDPGDDPLALPVAARGVDEGDAEFDRPVQGADGLVLLRADPPRAADTPCAVTDLGHGKPGAAQRTVAHASSSLWLHSNAAGDVAPVAVNPPAGPAPGSPRRTPAGRR